MKARRLFILCVVCSLGSGCVVAPPRPPDARLEQQWVTHAAALAPVSSWDLRGRLAVRTDSRGGQAALSWQRTSDHQSIRLNGPFGSGAVRVTQGPGGARLEDAENRVYEASTAEQLVTLYTGWQLPLANLDWWLRGLPVPDRPGTRELDDAGRLRILRQQGWTVEYESYMRIEDLDLPNRLTLTRAPEDGMPGLQARFVIERWGQVK